MSVLKVGARVMAVAALAALLATQLDASDVARAFAEIPLAYLAAALLLEWAFYAIETGRLYFLFERRISPGPLLRSRLVSAIISTFLPGIISGDVVRVFLLDAYIPGRKARSFLVLLASRLYGLLAMGPLLAVRFPPAVLAVLLPLFVGPVLRRPSAPGRFRELWDALRVMSSPGIWAIGTLTSITTGLIAVTEFAVLGHALGLEVAFRDWVWVVPFVALATMLPVGLGAVGPQEGALAITAHLLGLPLDRVIALSVALHVTRLAGMTPGIFFAGEISRFVAGRKRLAADSPA